MYHAFKNVHANLMEIPVITHKAAKDSNYRTKIVWGFESLHTNLLGIPDSAHKIVVATPLLAHKFV